MPTPDWKRVKSIVSAALDLEAAARLQYVERACENDPELRDEVLSLLQEAESEGGDDFLEPPEMLEAEPVPSLIGHTIDKYSVTSEIGRGGMGVVYLANDLSLQRKVALKVLTCTFTTPETHVLRFRREARAAAKLRHQNIVPIFADGSNGSMHWMAMERVDGHDLGKELDLHRSLRDKATRTDDTQGEQSILPPMGQPGHIHAIAKICSEVADALQHAHDAQIVHRDVKPSNILLDREGRARIGDFGLARDTSLGSLTLTGDLAGTPHYMSPEQVSTASARKVDHRTDVYSLGVVLYEMLSLVRPFDGPDLQSVLNVILHRKARALRSYDRDIPPQLALICRTAMEKDKQLRYQSAGELADDLRRFLRHDRVVAVPVPLRARLRRGLRDNSRLLIAGTLITIGACLGAIYAFQRSAKLASERASVATRIEARSPSGKPLAGTVSYQVVDPLFGTLSAKTALGALPVADRLPRAILRITVVVQDWGLREFDRFTHSTDRLELVAQMGEHQRSNTGMIRIRGGVMRNDEHVMLSTNGRNTPVDDFFMDECEVTNAAYRSFLDDSSRKPPVHWQRITPEHDNLPIVHVSWDDARAFAEWAGKRLPTYTEWVWAARGKENRVYPWANPVYGQLRGNTGHARVPGYVIGALLEAYFSNVAQVRSFADARTPEGMYHMLGNVREWTATAFALPMAPAQPNGQTRYEARLLRRLVAGHAWDILETGHSLKTYAHLDVTPSFADAKTGFRCVRSARD